MKFSLSPRHGRLCALVTGLLGFGLRIWLLKTGVDTDGLLVTSHPANAASYILIAVCLGLLVLCLGKKESAPMHRSAPVSIMGYAAFAIGILITDVTELLSGKDIITFFSCIVGIAAAGCLLLLALGSWKQQKPKPVLHGCLTVYLMLHLICQYRQWSAEPQLQNYIFQLLASVCLMLSAYYRTAMDSGVVHRKELFFFNYSALFFCCMAMAGDNWILYLTAGTWAACCNCSMDRKKQMYLPEDVRYCIDTLKNAGYDTYAVGGCVRDALLGLTPQDYDLCTAAKPEQIVSLFASHTLVRSGEKHGTIGVVIGAAVYEITTFRCEGGYTDSRHPDWVKFVPTIEEDLARRDFTVNAIAYSPERGYVDPWGGEKDLHCRCLRAVGDPKTRFTEDALRILRGVRFAVRFDLTPEEETLKAMFDLKGNLDQLAKERVFSELCKLIMDTSAEDLIRFCPIITQVIPELTETVGFDQHSVHHAYDVYTHTAHAVEAVKPELALRLAALLHDVGKPVTFTRDDAGRGHFYGHGETGAVMAEDILLRLKAPTALRQRVVFLISHHMTPFEPNKKLLRRQLSKYGSEQTLQLLQLQYADCISKGVDEGEEEIFDRIHQLLEEVLQEEACLHIRDLAINGNDLLQLGFAPGPKMGSCMQYLLQQVQDEQLQNEPQTLLAAAKAYFENYKEETL